MRGFLLWNNGDVSPTRGIKASLVPVRLGKFLGEGSPSKIKTAVSDHMGASEELQGRR